jgi:hypothetical protein
MDEWWFYQKDGQQHGPVGEEALRSMFASGELSPTTLVWKEGMDDWKPAGQVDWFVARRLVPPPVVAPPPYIPDAPLTGPSGTTDNYRPSGPQVRPWVRYWARMADLFAFSLAFFLVAAFVYPPTIRMNNAVLGMIIVFVYMFVEPIMLSSWGTTPGKALLRIRLRLHDGEKLAFSDAMGRSFRVWRSGEGLGVPIVSLIRNYISYRQLVEAGKTPWDSKGNFDYSHRIIGPARVVATIVLFAVASSLAFWGMG